MRDRGSPIVRYRSHEIVGEVRRAEFVIDELTDQGRGQLKPLREFSAIYRDSRSTCFLIYATTATETVLTFGYCSL